MLVYSFSSEAKNMAGLSNLKKQNKDHHNLTDAVRIREEKAVTQMKTTIESFTDPFEENSDSLFNLITKSVVDEKVKEDNTQAQSERLPPTQEALRNPVLRTNYETLIWKNDIESSPELPTPDGFGWKIDSSGRWVPEMTKKLPAPEAIIELVKCGCSKHRCNTNRCQCRKAGLTCTQLCACCNDDDDAWENMKDDDDGNEDDVVSDDSDDSEMETLADICNIFNG
ncbi:hypothetical protein AC249_AIPGENE26021 [Exaiptasia diaphana]|nr:hypothetical protein AC249_AIPGENE26021 [Exaiptasia diaphana]